jgi:SAM-dependent methyltransferase
MLRSVNAKRVLDLGCGTGNDVVRLEQEGFSVIGLDFSLEALGQAKPKVSGGAFVRADMATLLPFATDAFDAVMSNVSVHMFADAVTRRLFAEVGRITSPAGSFVFHVNSTEDAILRRQGRPPVKSIEENYVLEPDGQTMHFFSGDYLRDLLAGWGQLRLAHVTIVADGSPLKRVWRGIATYPPVTST